MTVDGGGWRRAWDGLRRRARRAARWVRGRTALAPAEAALGWVLRQGLEGGLPAREGETAVCPATTRRGIAVLGRLGLSSAAAGWHAGRPERAGGRLPAGDDEDARCAADPASSQAWARRAVLGYRCGETEAAGAAMERLVAVQETDGGFPATVGAGGWFGVRRGGRRSVGAALDFLDAAGWQVRAAFTRHAGEFPESIDADDGRWRAVERWLERLPAGAVVADLGCGRGRFLRAMHRQAPHARLLGIDGAPAMLAGCAPHAAVAAGLLQLPLGDAAVDAALAVESLEHALLPKPAVDEMCRVVRPGGWVLVIDKDRSLQSLSHHDPWERWFAPEELRQWLSRWCDEVRVEHVSHLEGRPGTRLFLAAWGRRAVGAGGGGGGRPRGAVQ